MLRNFTHIQKRTICSTPRNNNDGGGITFSSFLFLYLFSYGIAKSLCVPKSLVD